MTVDPNNRSEHGLAHVIPPRDLTRDEYINQTWQLILSQDLGEPIDEPDWLDDPILSRITLSSPRLAAPFRGINQGQDWSKQVKPFNFILVAHVAPLGQPEGVDPHRFRIITTYTDRLSAWADWGWRNIYDPSGQTYRITTTRHDATRDDRPHSIAEVQTFRGMVNRYRNHPEAKYAAAVGHVCQPGSRGPLSRRAITPRRLRVIGKETNELDQTQTGLYGSSGELVREYWTSDVDLEQALERLSNFSGRQLAKRLEIDRRTIDRIRRGSRPSAVLRERIVALDVLRNLEMNQSDPAAQDDLADERAPRCAISNPGRSAAYVCPGKSHGS